MCTEGAYYESEDGRVRFVAGDGRRFYIDAYGIVWTRRAEWEAGDNDGHGVPGE